MSPDVSKPKPINWPSIEGSPHPLGVSYIAEEDAYNFALYSQNAREVTLLFYSADDLLRPILEVRLHPLSHKTKRVWHCRLPRQQLALAQARYYAYRVNGPAPRGPNQWHAFDPEKILLDPYAKALFFPPEFSRERAKKPGGNGGQAPLGVLAPQPARNILPS
ncbi:MAG TPA: hypothetical protein VIH54_14440, partial [Chthoniobacterales bacterium]